MNGNQVVSADNRPVASQQISFWAFVALTLLSLFFIGFISLKPNPDVASANQGGLAFRFILFDSLPSYFDRNTLRDFVTNVLFYLPFGLFLSLAVSTEKPRFLSRWVFGGFLLSLTMETLQSMMGRNPDILDLISNSGGFLLGFWSAVVAIRFFGFQPPLLLGLSADHAKREVQTLVVLRFLYVCFYLFVTLLPFDIAVGVTKIYGQLSPDALGNARIILDPLFHFYLFQTAAPGLLLDLLLLLPIGLLTAVVLGHEGRLNLFSPTWVCLLAGAAAELIQVFVMSKTSDVVVLPLAVIAGLLAWGAAKAWLFRKGINTTSKNTSKWCRQQAAIAGSLIYFFSICIFAWNPVVIEGDIASVFRNLMQETNLVPFKLHAPRSNPANIFDLLKGVALYVPLGALITTVVTRHKTLPTVLSFVTSASICALVSAFIEISKVTFVGRHIDITNMLLACTGGVGGALLMRTLVLYWVRIKAYTRT